MNYIIPFKKKNNEECDKQFVINMDYIIGFNNLPKKEQHNTLTLIKQYMNPFLNTNIVHKIYIEQHNLCVALNILCNTNYTINENYCVKKFVKSIFKEIDGTYFTFKLLERYIVFL